MKFSNRLAWPALTNELSEIRAQRLVSGSKVLDFSESNPTRVGFMDADPDLAGLLSGPEILKYSPDPHGLGTARRALAKRGEERGAGSNPDRLFLSASTSEAYGWLFKLLCDPGDAVLVPKPGYPLFDYLAGLESVEPWPYRLDYIHPSGWRIDLDSVAEALEGPRGEKIRAIVVINPNNPTGSYLSRPEREALVGLCLRHGLAIISDEVFFDFDLEVRDDRESMAKEERVLTFVLDGLSKLVGLPGFKLAWTALSGPEAVVAEAAGRLEIIADAYLSAGTPVMTALPAILRRAPGFVSGMRARMRENLGILRKVLEYPGSPHRILRCEGGWTALVHSPRLESEESIARRLLVEEGLWVHPGYFFDMETEACFAAGLIMKPELIHECAIRYRSVFDRLMS